MRVDYRFGPNTPDDANAGLMYHLTEDYPRFNNRWPRSIETQMRKNTTANALSIAMIKFDTYVDPISLYKDEANQIPNYAADYHPGSDFVVTSYNNHWREINSLWKSAFNPYKDNEWNTMEIIVRGADSAEHICNSMHLLKLYDIRVDDPQGSGEIPWDKGRVSLQAEGAEVNYRNWEIMEIPAISPFNYQSKLFFTMVDQNVNPVTGQVYDITWEHIGMFNWVKLEYSILQDQWLPIITETENDGSYLWTVPQLTSDSLKIKISSESWVMVDETVLPLSISSILFPPPKVMQPNIPSCTPGRVKQILQE